MQSIVLHAPTETVDAEKLSLLYNSVGWTSYTKDPASLVAAVEGSDYVVTALEHSKLVGMARAISDDASIVYIQDILVNPTHQGQGLGRSSSGPRSSSGLSLRIDGKKKSPAGFPAGLFDHFAARPRCHAVESKESPRGRPSGR